ncbi:MAG TPA: cellulase family glycosylhydrolase, partial [Pyrinomonadaceae bacterium]|nr:cellulase family glycosylhydrolase [Pyrinomonadaceae bacterium]
MAKKVLVIAALAASVGSAIFLFGGKLAGSRLTARPGFVHIRGGRFMIDGRPFRFAGANVAVIYGDEERARMPETMRQAAQAGARVVRIWAFGESGTDDGPQTGIARNGWLHVNPFRRGPEEWNEAAFVSLDRAIAEAPRHNLRVQLCLGNWWRDTGGVVRYLSWAGLTAAADESQPFGINGEQAMLFYSNETTRRLYREHLQRIAARRNTVTGVLYRDDPTIFAYELMNEAQAVTGRWTQRRAWIAEMSAYLKSLDPDHLIAPGDWGYRTAVERREWLADHSLPKIDYCDVHLYPRDDHDSFVDSPTALREFVENRVAAAYSLGKPLVFGEFGMSVGGYNKFSQADWYRAYFEANAREGAAGAMFWILTPDGNRDYGVSFSTPRDAPLSAALNGASQLFASSASERPPGFVRESEHHRVPRQFAFTRTADDSIVQPQMIARDDHTLLYRFKPEAAVAQRFEKIGGGPGYIWGSGVGFVEYMV